MSLRDIYTTNDDKPIILNAEPMGNGSGLGDFHTINPEDREPSNTPKILGGLAVALMLGAAGAYVYSVSGHQPKQIVAANSLPAPSAPAPVAAPAPMPASDNNQAANTPAPQAAPAPATDTKPVSKPAAVRSASVSKPARTSDMGAAQTRMQADSTPAVQPQQQAVVTPVEPVSPQAPASALANNNVQQPATEAAPQPAQSATPQADNAAPAQDQQTATPAQPAPAQ